MKTAIDSAGRVVIPKELRERAALRPGTPLEARYADGAVVIEPAPTPVRLVRKGTFLVAVPEGPTSSLTERTVEDTRKRLREERGGGS